MKSYVSSVVGLLPFGGLDQLCIAQAESVFQPSVCLLCQEWSFFYCLFCNLRRRNDAYTVKNPINNNILRVVDPTGCELIVTGRGLGFGASRGTSWTPERWSAATA